ncbi:MAG TPA: sugar ABC transporter substrate-binding protein [bacterium]|nr:sugar ABC transporter substrate-binding protein [bacterium]
MKKTTVVLWAVLSAVLLAGCSKNNGQTVRLAQFLTDPVLIEKMTRVVHDIEARHPGLHIQVDNIPYNEYQQKITTQLAAGNAPDVIFVEVNNFVDLYLRGVFEDLTPYCQKDGVDLKGYYEGLVRRFSPDGKTYVLPQDTAPSGLVFYNKKLFREAGLDYPTAKWSWPEPFLTICKKLTKTDAAGNVTRWAFTDAYSTQYDNFLYSNGSNYVDDEAHPTRLILDDPKAIEAITFRWALIQKHHVSPDPSQIQTISPAAGQMDMFLNGRVAMLCSGIWQTPRFLEKKDLDFDVVEFPRGPQGIQGWGTGGSGYAVSKSSKNKDLAWLVAKEMTTAASLTQMTQTGMMQPALKSLAESDIFLKAPGAEHKAILLKMPAHAHYQPFLASWPEIFYGTLTPALDSVWMSQTGPADVLPGLTKKINEKYFKK